MNQCPHNAGPTRSGFVLMLVVGLVSLLLILAVGLAVKVNHQKQQVGSMRKAANLYLKEQF
jgi:hypothetical protein